MRRVEVAAQPFGPTCQRRAVARVRELGVAFGELRAFLDVECHVDVRSKLLGEVAAPGRDLVVPHDDPEPVRPERLDRERSRPTVVDEELHGRALPRPGVLVAVLELRSDLRVAVREDVGGHGHVVAGDPLDGEAAAVDIGAYALDGDRFRLVSLGDDALQPQLLVARGLARLYPLPSPSNLAMPVST